MPATCSTLYFGDKRHTSTNLLYYISSQYVIRSTKFSSPILLLYLSSLSLHRYFISFLLFLLEFQSFINLNSNF